MNPIGFSPIVDNIAASQSLQTGSIGTGNKMAATGSEFSLPSTIDGQSTLSINGGNDLSTVQTSSMAAQTINEPTNWSQLVHKMVTDVNNAEQTAGAKVRDVLAGGPTPVHEALLATEEANTSFQVLAEMRNKVIDAYNEVKNMSV